MGSKQVLFFSAPEDFKSLIEFIELNSNIKYYETGLFDSPTLNQYLSLLDIPDLGYVTVGDWNQCKSYLVITRADDIHVRDVPQRAGGIKYAVDQKFNPKSIVVKPGGKFKDGILMAGLVGSISNDPVSVELFIAFSKAIKKSFKKVGAFYVSPLAKEFLDNGWRLVTNEKSPQVYDLKV